MGKILEKIGVKIIFIGDKIYEGFLKVRKLFVYWKHECWGLGTMIISPTSCYNCRHLSKRVYSNNVVCRCKVYDVILMRPLEDCHFHDTKRK